MESCQPIKIFKEEEEEEEEKKKNQRKYSIKYFMSAFVGQYITL